MGDRSGKVWLRSSGVSNFWPSIVTGPSAVDFFYTRYGGCVLLFFFFKGVLLELYMHPPPNPKRRFFLRKNESATT